MSSCRQSCQGGDTDVEVAGKLFRNLSVTFLKRRESVNPLGGKEGIELSRMTNLCSKRQALQDFPKRSENETGIEVLSKRDTVVTELRNVKILTQIKSFKPNFTQRKRVNCNKFNTPIE